MLQSTKATQFIIMSLDGSELSGDTSVSIADSDAVDSLSSTVLMRQMGTQITQSS